MTPAVWTLRVDLPRDPNNPTQRRQKATTYKGTRDEAEEALHRFVLNVESELEVPFNDGLKLSELFDKWREAPSSRQKPRAKSTVFHDLTRWKKWIEPEFGQRVATSLKSLEIEEFYERVRADRPDGEKGLSPNSVVRIHSLLAAMTKWGYRKQLIRLNPMEYVTKPMGESLPPEAPSLEEVESLLDFLWDRDRRLWLAVRLTATLGMRRSELLAITWPDFVIEGDLDKEEGRLRISSDIVSVPKGEGDNKSTLVTTDTKGGAKSHRTLRLDRELTGVIRNMAQEMKIRRLGGYVFNRDAHNEHPWYPDTLTRKLSEARSEMQYKFGVPPRVPITFRSLRIFCASRLYANSADLIRARAVLGHSSLVTTDRYYVAFSDEQHREATVEVGNQLTRSPLKGVSY